MGDVLLWTILVVTLVTCICAVASLLRKGKGSQDTERGVREELRAGREEARAARKDHREEIASNLRFSTDAIAKTLEAVAKAQQAQLDAMAIQLKGLTESNQAALDRIRTALDLRVKELREGNEKELGEMRTQSGQGLRAVSDALANALDGMNKSLLLLLDGMTKQLKELAESNQGALERTRTTFDTRVKELQEGNAKELGEMRKQSTDGLATTSDALSKALEKFGQAQQLHVETMTKQVKDLTESNQTALDRIRTTFDARVKELQEGNEKKLDEMRKTVDEKLHDTLEKRLGESFKLVGDRLEAVHKGLGEMQTLASGVGDLKRVLTNVKARGTWAEVQLGALLEQVLTPEQYGRNVCLKPESSERVEYAIRLPGPADDRDIPVWLPIDSKFPQEDYVRLQDAAERADADGVQAATEALSRTVRNAAKEIHDKYVNPPITTDFGIMFLATEGLYAEVLRQPTLVEELQKRYRVVLAGPTSLVAILSSLRMGFQTLAIEQRASEVWRVLGAVKTEFGKFGDVLDKVKKQLTSASNTIEQTGVRTRALERKLRTVEQLSDAESARTLALTNEAMSGPGEDSDFTDAEEGAEGARGDG